MTATTLPYSAAPSARQQLEAATYLKVAWRLLPLLFICYVAAYLDRVNVGFAKLQMLNGLQFRGTVWASAPVFSSSATSSSKAGQHHHAQGGCPGLDRPHHDHPGHPVRRDDVRDQPDHGLAGVLCNARVWLVAALYFCCMTGLYGVFLCLPTLIKAAGVKDPLDVGTPTDIPYGCAVVAVLFNARSADRNRERRWHFAVASALGGMGLLLATLFGNNVTLAMAALSPDTAGILATMPVFCSDPGAILDGTAAEDDIALIHSAHKVAGFVSPSVIGRMRDVTHCTNAGVYVV